MPQVAKLAMRAVQELGWKIDNVNETLGLVTFETGITWGSWSGVWGSLSIEEVGENQFRVSGAGKQNVRGGHFVALNLFGEAEGKVTKVLNKMRELAEWRFPKSVRARITGGVNLISCALPFGRLWYGEPNAITYAKFRSRSHDAVIRVYDEAGNVIETHEHIGDFKEW
jgi:hypothetical protein